MLEPTERQKTAFRDCFALFSVLLDDAAYSGTMLSVGLRPFMSVPLAPHAHRTTPEQLRRRQSKLVRRRDRLDPLHRTMRKWARAELSQRRPKHLRHHGRIVFTLRDQRIPKHRRQLSYEIKSLVCLAAYKLTPSELVTLASHGDNRSLFKLVSLDNVFLTAKFVQDQIWWAQGGGDKSFFKELARVIQEDTYTNYAERAKTTIGAYLAWFLGFQERTKGELFEFLVENNATEYQDFDNFNRLLRRVGLTRWHQNRG